MTQTIQPRSVAFLTKSESTLFSPAEATEAKNADLQESKSILDNLLCLSDSLDNLYIALSRLNYLADKYFR